MTKYWLISIVLCATSAAKLLLPLVVIGLPLVHPFLVSTTSAAASSSSSQQPYSAMATIQQQQKLQQEQLQQRQRLYLKQQQTQSSSDSRSCVATQTVTTPTTVTPLSLTSTTTNHPSGLLHSTATTDVIDVVTHNNNSTSVFVSVSDRIKKLLTIRNYRGKYKLLQQDQYQQQQQHISETPHDDKVSLSSVYSSRWLGEGDVSLISKLLYRYATPLINKASNNQTKLDVYDALPIPTSRRMKHSVSSLQNVYNNQRRLQHQLASATATSKNTLSSESWILTKSIILDQKDMLLRTGILRFFNTAIQAFPALLVARLLRSAEAVAASAISGDNYSSISNNNNVRKAVYSAIALVAVLTIKMIIENQYFHNLIHCSTQVRGSLAGLLFDKSFKLQNGGVGTIGPTSGTSTARDNNNDSKKIVATGGTGSTELGIGGVLNLMQSDTSIIESATVQFHTSWDGPLQIAIYTALLYKYLGASVFYGISVLLFTIPLNSVTLRILNKLATAENQAKDARTKQTSESIRNMKLLKVQNWEALFESTISKHRTRELRLLVLRGVVRAINMAISNAVPAIVLVVTLAAYVKSGKPLVASTIFTAISLFNQLRFPLFFYPMYIDAMANGKNAMKRITDYLSLPEIVPYVQQLPPVPLQALASNTIQPPKLASHEYNDSSETSMIDGGSIEMKHGDFVWSPTTSISVTSTPQQSSITNTTTPANFMVQPTYLSSEDFTPTGIPALVNVELIVNPGEVVAVVGSVGSGKSALIKGLLGELKPAGKTGHSSSHDLQHQQQHPPTVIRHGDVAYCSQESWLSKGTIREAILFGREYNEHRYREAIYNSGLNEDIADGDCWPSTNKATNEKNTQAILSHDTDVGEGGSSLSGGQRARVAIARALYSVSAASAPKIYLLDDCLAALDAHVGSIVFERMISYLRQINAATILVTNDPNVPRRCDRVILMGPTSRARTDSSSLLLIGTDVTGSTIIDQGKYDELIQRGHNLRSFGSHDINNEDEKYREDDKSYKLQPALTYGEQNKSDFAGTSDDFVVHPSLVVSNAEEKKTVIGATGTADADLCLDVWCHADVEDQATMQNCPDYIADVRSVSVKLPGSGSTSGRNELVGYIDDDETFKQNSTSSQSDNRTDTTTNTINNENTPSRIVDGPSIVASMPTQTTISKALTSADDNMSTGAVPLSIYASYFKAVGNPILVVGMIVAFLLSNGAQFFQQYTVAKWTEVGATTAVASSRYMNSLVRVAFFVSISLWVRSFLTMSVGVKASKTFHSKMLRSVFAAPMSFFDTTPSGQLLSRFGKEIETIDRGVPDSIGAVLFCFLQIGLSMGALAGAVTPGMLVPLAAISILYVNAMSKFRPAAREMKRIEAKTRSPIYTHFGEALRGSETIRSIRDATSRWSDQHRILTDTNLRVFYTVKAFDRWLSTRLETLGNTVVFTTAIASVILTRSGTLKAGSAGWGLTQALSVTGLLTWAVRCLTDLESNMLSVMRVKELTSSVDSQDMKLQPITAIDTIHKKRRKSRMPKELSKAGEALEQLVTSSLDTPLVPLDNSKSLIRDGWPWRGNIEFKNVSMRYSPSGPYVLRNVNLTVPAGSTLGVVGRTGSGKSSLLATLFRLVEIESTPGDGTSCIEIDGVDIRSVSMGALRQSVAIIPQDPVLFTGTLAFNLDATGRSSRQDMIKALEAASPSLVKQFGRGTTVGTGYDVLETQISEGGKNLSLGQRQLVCLARALLRRSKILVLDEATSSVDAKTDQEVQETIQREFVQKGVTVITVAHRLETVLGYEKIAVLGSGQVLEYGPPNELIAIPGGELRRLVLADRQNQRKGSQKAFTEAKNFPPVRSKQQTTIVNV